MISLIALGLIVLAAYTTQAMIGFGANIIALSLGAQFWPLQQLLPIVVALNLPLSGWLVWKYRRDVAWGALAHSVAPLFGGGFIAGLFAAHLLHSEWLAFGFGVIVTLIATWELSRRHHRHRQPRPVISQAFLGLGGITQGLYASGGPFVAYAVDRLGLTRSGFRATLLVIWLTTNSLLLTSFALTGQLDGAFIKNVILFLPLIALGLWCGEHLHQRVSDTIFRRGLDLVLLFAGGILMLQNLPI